MVGTRHAVSDNNSKSGLGMPSPYIPEREQVQDDGVGLKRETESGGSFYERRKAGREKRDATKRKDKDMEGKILPSRAHEHVVREDEGELPGRTRTSHPEDKIAFSRTAK